jgi:FtsZ-binding cell division protein ZapB
MTLEAHKKNEKMKKEQQKLQQQCEKLKEKNEKQKQKPSSFKLLFPLAVVYNDFKY